MTGLPSLRSRIPTRRRLAVPALVVTVLSLLAALLPVAPASAAAPPRNDGWDNIVFVHGFDPGVGTPGHDCAAYWSAMRAYLQGTTERTWGYYSGNTNCSVNYAGSRDTSLNDLAREFSQFIARTYPNQQVDVVAHSMGGLIVRRAISGSQRREAGFAYPIYVEDVVTLGTPHGGANLAGACGTFLQQLQCKQMAAGSDFLTALASNAQSAFGTDWTVIGSEGDATVTATSATAMSAGHKRIYLRVPPSDPCYGIQYWSCLYPVPTHTTLKSQAGPNGAAGGVRLYDY
jgi:triacylglycerol esterase/lipase EstA (alpha/beta hydrolase family)